MQIRRLLLPLLLFLIVIIEGVALQLLPKSISAGGLYIIPHWVFIALLISAIFYDKDRTYYSVVYGAIFGLLIDIVYTDFLGVYMFSYAAVIYVIHELKNKMHENMIVTIILAIFGLGFVDLIIHTIYFVVGATQISWSVYLLNRMLPTSLANIFFLIPLYILFARRMEDW